MADGVFFGTVDAAGRFELDNLAAFKAYTRSKFTGKKVELIVRARRTKASDEQRKFWFGGAVALIAEELGWDRHDRKDLHYYLLKECFGTHFVEIGDGDRLEIPNVKSWTELNTKQGSELIDWVVRWAADKHGIQVPLPGDVAFDAKD